MKHYLYLIKDILLNALFPLTCPACEMENQSFEKGFCPDCFKKINFIKEPLCNICGAPFNYETNSLMVCEKCIKNRPYFDKARAVFLYDNFSKQMILNFKHGDATYNAKFFAKIMFNSYKKLIKDCDVIIPVPLHKARLLKRKYNQAGLISKHLAKLSNKVFLPLALNRKKNTLSQGHFDENERLKNIENAFEIKNNKDIIDKNIALIDDVFTTGATVNECAKILIENGAKSVFVITLAKTKFNQNQPIKIEDYEDDYC